MYAIVKTSGQQLSVEPGKFIKVNRLQNEVGSEYEIGEVLLYRDGEKFELGSPYIENAKVVCRVSEHFRDKKIIVFKKKRRKKYRRKQGHRQDRTTLEVLSINI